MPRHDVTALIRLIEQAGFDGMPCFSANETLDPCLTAAAIAAQSGLTPIVAVNPVYMQSFSATKMVSSITLMHGRRVIPNLITGTSSCDRAVLGDASDHAARYRRLADYADIIRRLLSQRQPFSAEGRFYTVREAVLAATPVPDLQPRRPGRRPFAGCRADSGRHRGRLAVRCRTRNLPPVCPRPGAGLWLTSGSSSTTPRHRRGRPPATAYHPARTARVSSIS